jgi:hypothetical protein
LKKAIYYFWSLSTLVGILLVAIEINLADSDTHLKPPGHRLVSDPATVIPATHHYLNRKLALPRYRNASGTPLEGWSREFIKTRRFSSDQSAWIYYRQSDLMRTKVIKASGLPDTMRIWPVGSTLILEGYKGDAARDTPDSAAAKNFFPIDWSYARYTPNGAWSLSGEKLNECHQCHSIAFRLTGDLVFTLFR